MNNMVKFFGVEPWAQTTAADCHKLEEIARFRRKRPDRKTTGAPDHEIEFGAGRDPDEEAGKKVFRKYLDNGTIGMEISAIGNFKRFGHRTRK
jgi:hypothetical protein